MIVTRKPWSELNFWEEKPKEEEGLSKGHSV